MKLRLTCRLDGTASELVVDGVPQVIVWTGATQRTGNDVVLELHAEPAAEAAVSDTLPPPPETPG